MHLVFLMYFLFASVFTVGKVSLTFAAPFFLTGVRMLMAGGILLGFLWLRKPASLYLKKRDLPLMMGLAFFNVFITNALEFWALQYMETAKTCLIYSLSPFPAIIFAYIFLTEKMSWKKWAGLLVGVLGMLPIFLTPSEKELSLGRSPWLSIPVLAVSVSAITAVIGWTIMKKLMRDRGYSFVTANMFSFLFGGGFSLIASFFIEKWDPLPLTGGLSFLPSAIYIAIIHNVICYNLYAYSLNRFSIPFMTFAGFTNPLFTAALGWFFLGEHVGLAFLISFLLIIGGILLYAQDEWKPKALASKDDA